MNLKTISLITCGLLAASADSYGQQVFATGDLLRGCAVDLEGGQDNTTLGCLTDGNDRTCFVAENITKASFLFNFDKECLVKGINIVAGGDVNHVPSRMVLYGRADSGSAWTAIGRFNTVAFDEPYTSFTGSTLSSTKSYSQYKLEITKIKSGNALEIAELQILGQQADNGALSTSDNGEYSASGNVSDLWAADGNSLGSVVTLKNVRAQYGVENAWLQYSFNTPTAIDGYSLITSSGAMAASRPVTWELLASDDAQEWVTLDMRNNEDAFAVDNYEIRRSLGKSDQYIDFAAVADELHDMLNTKFYRTRYAGKYYIHAWNADASKENLGFNYWWMAHAIDANIDAYIRTGESKYQMRARQLRSGMYGNSPTLWNTFYDDMEWMNLACIRAYQNLPVEPSKWLEEAVQLYDWIWGGWNYDDGTEGGIRWNSSDDGKGKNSCSNAPAIIGAAKLYQITGNKDYLDKAVMIYEWMLTHSRFEDGFIKDGPKNENRGWAFTYNQGTWVGGLLELYRITQDRKYYDVAVDLMDKSIDSRWYSPEGIMREQGASDGGLFKGIYVRYITDWIVSGFLDSERQGRYARFLVENARSMYNCALHKPDMTVMPNWKDRAGVVNGENNGGSDGSYHASIALSGVFLCESMDRMRRAGVLNDDYSVKNPNAGHPFTHYRLKVTANGGASDIQIGGFRLYSANPQTSSIERVEAGSSDVDIAVSGGGITVGCNEEAMVEVFTIDGRLWHRGQLSGQTLACNPGLYLVKVTQDDATTVKKVAL